MSELDLSDFVNWPKGRVGMVAIVGRPNVGKSTFLNRALEYRLTAVSSKPQTTRRHWRGILSTDDSQIVFVDTPGVHESSGKLGAAMMDSVRFALKDADLVLSIIDPTREWGAEDQLAAEHAAASKSPVLLVVNKCDVAGSEEKQESRAAFEAICSIVGCCEISALEGTGVDELLETVRGRLPEGPFFYPEDQLTDAIQREIGSELIREAAFNHLREEVPHALAVEIDSWREEPKKTRIRATLHVDHGSQVPIVVGRGGERLQAITREAISGLRDQLEGRVDLKLHVKATPNWRENPQFLQALGLQDG